MSEALPRTGWDARTKKWWNGDDTHAEPEAQLRPRVAEWERAEISSFMSMNSALFSARL